MDLSPVTYSLLLGSTPKDPTIFYTPHWLGSESRKHGHRGEAFHIQTLRKKQIVYLSNKQQYTKGMML